MTKLYELNCLIQSNEIGSFEENLRNFIQKENGILLENKPPVKKKNTFFKDDRGKENSAFLMSLNFNLEADKLNGLKEIISQNNQVIRYLILNRRTPRVIKKRRIMPLTEFKEIKEVKELVRKKVDLDKIGEKLEEILEQ